MTDKNTLPRKFPLRIVIGVVLLVFGLVLLLFSYGPLLLAELRFSLATGNSPLIKKTLPFATQTQEIVPQDREFGIVIPKIGANAPVIANVDPYNSFEYQRKLSQGVAHAKGTALPNRPNKTTFLFAHASGDILMARRYNAVFYLLNKLEAGDEIIIYFQGEPFYYAVTETKEVLPDAVSYLEEDGSTDLILMTCTPAGTDWRRLLVMAKLNSLI